MQYSRTRWDMSLKVHNKKQTKRLGKGEKMCRIWPTSIVLLSCITIRFWNIKEKNKKEKYSYIFTVESIRHQATLKYTDASKQSRLQNLYPSPQWPVSGEGHHPRCLPYHHWHLFTCYAWEMKTFCSCCNFIYPKALLCRLHCNPQQAVTDLQGAKSSRIS